MQFGPWKTSYLNRFADNHQASVTDAAESTVGWTFRVDSTARNVFGRTGASEPMQVRMYPISHPGWRRTAWFGSRWDE